MGFVVVIVVTLVAESSFSLSSMWSMCGGGEVSSVDCVEPAVAVRHLGVCLYVLNIYISVCMHNTTAAIESVSALIRRFGDLDQFS